MTDITDVREALSDCREEADRAWAIVDLQSKELDAHQAERMALFTELDRLRADVTQAYRDRADGRASERARIAAEVLAEPTLELATGVYVDLASVLEDINGEVLP